jgi:hypothetical protein
MARPPWKIRKIPNKTYLCTFENPILPIIAKFVAGYLVRRYFIFVKHTHFLIYEANFNLHLIIYKYGKNNFFAKSI